MSRVLLDTISLIWLEQGSKRLGRKSRKLIEEALAEETLFLSSLTFWELNLLILKQRVKLPKPLATCREDWLDMGLQELPVSERAVQHALAIPLYHSDPIDCLIMGTAMAHNMVLVTSDERILDWKGSLERQDAFK